MRLSVVDVVACLKGRLLKAVERTLSCDSASNSKVEKRVKDTSDSSVAQKNVILSGKELFFIFTKTLFIKNKKVRASES